MGLEVFGVLEALWGILSILGILRSWGFFGFLGFLSDFFGFFGYFIVGGLVLTRAGVFSKGLFRLLFESLC